MTHLSQLGEILAPMTEEAFFADYYQRHPLHLKGGKDRFRHLFSWQAVAEALNNAPFPHPSIKMNRQGRPVTPRSPAELREEMRKGTTLILDNADSYTPALGRFCDTLSYQYATPVRANAYGSFPGVQAFSNHYDTHDFFILQVEGKKRWTVFDRTVESPLYFAKSHGVEPPATPPVMETVLEEGDVLYVPKGFWHYAVSTEEPSLHLTLAVFVRTGIDFLNWLVGELREDVRFRRELPLTRATGRDSDAPHPYATPVADIVRNLHEVLAKSGLATRFEAYMAAHLLHRRWFRFPTDFMEPDALAAATVFARVGVTPLVRVGDKVTIAFHGKVLELDRRFAPAVEAIFAEPHGVVDLVELQKATGCSQDEIFRIATSFCREGLLDLAA